MFPKNKKPTDVITLKVADALRTVMAANDIPLLKSSSGLLADLSPENSISAIPQLDDPWLMKALKAQIEHDFGIKFIKNRIYMQPNHIFSAVIPTRPSNKDSFDSAETFFDLYSALKAAIEIDPVYQMMVRMIIDKNELGIASLSTLHEKGLDATSIELGPDSLDEYEAVYCVEEELGIALPDDTLIHSHKLAELYFLAKDELRKKEDSWEKMYDDDYVRENFLSSYRECEF